MKILCVSASNTKRMGENSASTKVCHLISDLIIQEFNSTTEVETIALAAYDLRTCNLCGDCSSTNKCLYDADFNLLYDKLAKADAIFWVVPHYSPIPAKLIICFEKINEISYASWSKNSRYRTPFHHKVTAVIGHGGMPESAEVLQYYHDKLVAPVADILTSLSFHIVPGNHLLPKGVAFGLADGNCIVKAEQKVFPDIIQDYTMIRERVRPLVKNVMEELSAKM